MKIWDHFAQLFGCGNILPIALAGSDQHDFPLPEGVRGKVPSVVNSYGQRVGYKEWQTGKAKAPDVMRWKKDPRYGFGIRLGFPLPGGGVAVCIDVDCEDLRIQMLVADALRNALGQKRIPMRVRDNSNRRAYVLCVETADQLPKRVFQLRKADKANGIKGEAVEILAHGQQFVAFGKHPSGAEIEWLDAPADDLGADVFLPDPTVQRLSLEAFNAFLDALSAQLPVIADTSKAARQRRAKGEIVKSDDVALFLDKEGWTLSVGAEGQRFIRSPFAHEYTTEQSNNDTSVCYFLKGTRDYEQGHFSSLHASDADRTDADFINAIGFIASQFESFPANVNESASPRPRFTQVAGGKHHDRIEATLLNVLAALASPGWLGQHIAYDDFTGDIVIGAPGNWRPLRDSDYVALRAALETKGFLPVGRDLIRDGVLMTAENNTIDTGREWLVAQKWDGVKRVDSFLQTHFAAEPGDYTRAVSRYIWTALAGRMLKPGSKADMMPIFVGAQGCGKSTGVEAMAPFIEWFTDSVSFRDKEDDQGRKLRGVIAAEFAEMVGIRKRDIEDIKAMVTRTHEKWVPKYKEFSSRYARRALFFGTSNDPEMLDDITGARRWLPVSILSSVDVPRIKRDCAQLWAEAAAMFTVGGIAHEEAQRLAIGQHEAFRVTDPAEEFLLNWLDTADELDNTSPRARGFVTTEAAINALKGCGVRIECDKAGQMRVAKMLAAAGFSNRVEKTVNKRKRRGYSNTPKFSH